MFFREIPCDDYYSINREIETWIHDYGNLVDTKSFWNVIDTEKFIKSVPRFQAWLRRSKLPLQAVAVTYGRSFDCCGPHTDTPPARFKLSWPVKNTKYTFNRWFRPKVNNPKIVINDLGGREYLLQDLEEIARREVIAPALIDAGQIHDVWCDSLAQFPRIVLQCHLFNEPNSLQGLA